MRINDLLSEINRIPASDYRGGKGELGRTAAVKNQKPLPGGSGFTYSVEKRTQAIVIKLYAPKQPGQPIGKLVLEKKEDFPVKNAYSVDTITVDEDYRGQSLGKSLYGIALSILKLTLLSGWGQTPGGRRNWVSLNNIPGVEVVGYFTIPDRFFDDDEFDYMGNQVDVDTIMGKIGAQYIGREDSSWGIVHYFAFPVGAAPKAKEMVELVKTEYTKLYNGNSWSSDNGMMARWTGE